MRNSIEPNELIAVRCPMRSGPTPAAPVKVGPITVMALVRKALVTCMSEVTASAQIHSDLRSVTSLRLRFSATKPGLHDDLRNHGVVERRHDMRPGHAVDLLQRAEQLDADALAFPARIVRRLEPRHD